MLPRGLRQEEQQCEQSGDTSRKIKNEVNENQVA